MNAFCYLLGAVMGAGLTLFTIWILRLYPPTMPSKDAPEDDVSKLI